MKVLSSIQNSDIVDGTGIRSSRKAYDYAVNTLLFLYVSSNKSVTKKKLNWEFLKADIRWRTTLFFLGAISAKALVVIAV